MKPEIKPSQTQAPTAPQAAQADLLGEAAVLKPPSVPSDSVDGKARNISQPAQHLTPAEDENQAAFIVDRHVPPS